MEPVRIYAEKLSITVSGGTVSVPKATALQCLFSKTVKVKTDDGRQEITVLRSVLFKALKQVMVGSVSGNSPALKQVSKLFDKVMTAVSQSEQGSSHLQQVIVKASRKPLEGVGTFFQLLEGLLHKVQEEGDRLEMAYSDGDRELAREKCERIDTVPRLMQQYKDELAYLNGLIQHGRLDEEQTWRRGYVEGQLGKLKGLAEGGPQWIDANRHRRNCQACMGKTAVELTRDNGAKRFIPGLVNLRVHSIQSPRENLCLVRCGAITDATNGGVNLQELPPSSDEYLARRSHLQDQFLQLLWTQVEAHKKEIEDPNSTVNQMGAFLMTQISLLDPSKQSKEKPPGNIHNETNQIKDMQAIFKEFEGGELIFDGKGPFVDEFGRVHLPLLIREKNGSPKELELRTVYHNISVQGERRNVGLQAEVNKGAFDTAEELLRVLMEQVESEISQLPEDAETAQLQLWRKQANLTLLQERLGDIRRRVEAGGRFSSRYGVAADLASFYAELGAAVGVNCYSGKDRTGYLMVILVLLFLKEQVKNLPRAKELLKGFGRQIWSALGIVRRVVWQNSQTRAVKGWEPTMEGLSFWDRCVMGVVAMRASA